MEVDFNNLRKQACFSYNELCRRLNNGIDSNPMGDTISIDVDDIETPMNNLRDALVTMICCSIPDDDNFKDVVDEVGIIEIFPPEEE